MRVVIASALMFGSTALAHAAELELPAVKPIARSEACHVEVAASNETKRGVPIHLSRRSAIYVVQHLYRACRTLADTAAENIQSRSIRGDIYDSLILPIARAYPDLSAASLPASSVPKVFKATSGDLGRVTANRLDDEITRLRNRVVELANEQIGSASDESAAKKVQQDFLDATAELSFAGKIVFDAYPDLFAKRMAAVPEQPRTAEHDAAFRKGAPPLGSVKLSDAAFALIQCFMRSVRRTSDNDEIAAIIWTRGQRSRRPDDTAWSDKGPGWILGVYRKTQLPPDVIDTIRGIKIVIVAEDSAALAGKTIDATKRTLFVRD